jgi:hypothetical protein
MAATTGINYQGRDGELRLYDKTQGAVGASGTPWCFVVKFEQMDFQAGWQARPEELVRLDRQRITDDAHLQLGSDEIMYQPVDVSFSFAMSSKEQDALLQFVGVDFASIGHTTVASWQVKGTPNTGFFGQAGLRSTKARAISGDGLYAGGRVDGKGSIVALQGFADVKKVAVDAEVIWTEASGDRPFGLRLKEVSFEPGRQQISESADLVTVRLTGMMYGEMQRITAFDRGMDILTIQHLLS